MSTTTRTPAPASGETPRGGISGKAFVVACVLFAAGFVAFLVFVSPVLLARTQAAAPPPAPHEVAAGDAAGQAWVATAVEGEPDVPCLTVEVLTNQTARTCTGLRGPALRAVESVAAGDTILLYGIVDARTTLVRFGLAGGGTVEVEPVYVDFGFPVGFFTIPLPDGDRVLDVEALDRAGELRDHLDCVHGSTGPHCRAGT